MKLGVLARTLCLLLSSALPMWCQSDWPMYGHDSASTRYSPLTQINTQNVQTLTAAWT